MNEAPLIGTVTVTEQGKPGSDVFHQCTALERSDGRLDIFRAADETRIASYAPGWSVRIDDGRTVLPVELEEEDDDES